MKNYLKLLFLIGSMIVLSKPFDSMAALTQQQMKDYAANNLCNGPKDQLADADCNFIKNLCISSFISLMGTIGQHCDLKFNGGIDCEVLLYCKLVNNDGSCDDYGTEDYSAAFQGASKEIQNKYAQPLSQACAIPIPVCGDGKVEGDEICDGTTKKGGLALSPGELCSKDCKIISVCGDGKTEGTEQCDYNDPTPLPAGKTCDSTCFLAIAFPDEGVGFSDAELHSYQVAACTNVHTKKCDQAYNSCLTTYEGIAVGDNNQYDCKKFGDGYHCKTKPFDDLSKKIQDMDFSVICPNPPPAVCGNGGIEEGEMCDDGAKNGQANCDASCKFTPSKNADKDCFDSAFAVCNKKKEECEITKQSGDTNCPQSFNQCLVNANNHCQLGPPLDVSGEFGHDRGNPGDTRSGGCSMTETVSTFGSVTPALIFTFGLVPLIARRLKKLDLEEKESKEELN